MTPNNAKSFIEVQFPVVQMSAEAYKERKAGAGQTLTRFGKWWGRKPLVLVRGLILGLLLPASDDPKMDRKVFMHLMRMDEEGLEHRKSHPIPAATISECLNSRDRTRWIASDGSLKKTTNAEKNDLQLLAFRGMTYRKKLEYCCRGEELDGVVDYDWNMVNNHLHTNAKSLPELVEQLGVQKFGHRPNVGDCFCGGGSVPFEAARIGCNSYGSDLNPIAALLTWGAITFSSLSEADSKKLETFQKKLYETVKQKMDMLALDSNENGWHALYYLYCTETVCPSCGYRIPMAPSWIISTKERTVALLRARGHGYDIDVVEHATDAQIAQATSNTTIQDSKLVCPHCHQTTSIEGLRTSNGALRLWEASDIRPQPNDVFQERLFCIAYQEDEVDKNGKKSHIRHYVAPSAADMQREEQAYTFLNTHFLQWQKDGIIPSMRIVSGDKTDEPIRTRSWQYWHQLFTPRQLLLLGTIAETARELAGTNKELAALGLLIEGRCADLNSRLSMWDNGYDKMENTFYNQALNTLWAYGSRSLDPLHNQILSSFVPIAVADTAIIEVADARDITIDRDLWITDPPYADMVNYDELSEFFLAWDKTEIERIFPTWSSDSRRALAVKGASNEAPFRDSMVSIYRQLVDHMSPNGRQLITFTHKDTSVWADMANILMDTGLEVLSAWNIATETESGGLKNGNYVKGTICMTLAKRTGHQTAFADEVFQQVKRKVKEQLDSMLAVDDPDEPSFGDSDYALAAYAATMEVITKYDRINDADKIKSLLERAVTVTYDALIPRGMSKDLWQQLTSSERLYTKGLLLEEAGTLELNAYQSMSKAFNVLDYQSFLASSKANRARVKAPSEWHKNHLAEKITLDPMFALLRAISITAAEDAAKGLHSLCDELPEFWDKKKQVIETAEYLILRGDHLHSGTWETDILAARLLLDAIRNDR